jgi:hypothetical protein
MLIAGVIALIALGLVGWARLLRPMSNFSVGAPGYIYVQEDGSARELTADETEYLNTEFHPADGGRPYIKSNYAEVTPDGKISGFLRRNMLPRSSVVAPVQNTSDSEI